MCTICHKRSKMGHSIQKNVTNAFHHCIRLLPFIECITQSSVDSNDVVNVPENLFQEVGPTRLRNYVLIFEANDPSLCSISVSTSEQCQGTTHVAKIFHVAYEVPLSVDNFVNGFLSLLLGIRHTINNLLWHRMDP